MKTKAWCSCFFLLSVESAFWDTPKLIWMMRFPIGSYWDLLDVTWPQNSILYPFLLNPDLWGDGQWQSKAGQATHCQAKAPSWLVWFLEFWEFIGIHVTKIRTQQFLPPAVWLKGLKGIPSLKGIHGFQLQLLPQWNGFGCHFVGPSNVGGADWFLFQLTKWCPCGSMVKFWNVSFFDFHACTTQFV